MESGDPEEAAVYILFSSAQPTEQTQQVSHRIWYSTLLLGSMRYGLLREIWLRKQCNRVE